MRVVTGKVVNGRIEVDDCELTEGAEVSVSLYDGDPPTIELSPELEAELEESFAQIERGEYIDGDDVIRELRRRCGST